MVWIYKSKEVSCHEDLLEGCTDFVYRIDYVNGQIYLGKKTVRSIRRKPPLKGKKRKRLIMTDHPFVKYEGSHGKVIGLEVKTKEILFQCNTKKAATYLETALLFHYDAIFDPQYVNENISGKFWDNDLNGLIEY